MSKKKWVNQLHSCSSSSRSSGTIDRSSRTREIDRNSGTIDRSDRGMQTRSRKGGLEEQSEKDEVQSEKDEERTLEGKLCGVQRGAEKASVMDAGFSSASVSLQDVFRSLPVSV